MKRPKLLLAAFVLLIGAASAVGSKVQGSAEGHAQGTLVLLKQKGGF